MTSAPSSSAFAPGPPGTPGPPGDPRPGAPPAAPPGSGAVTSWRGESIRSILGAQVPYQSQSALNRWLMRFTMLAARRSVISIDGLEHIAPDRDPFVLVMNHNQRREAVALPTVLIHVRHGKLIHFWSDWMFQLLPVIGLVLRRSQVITVTTKPARPRILNVFRPLFADPVPAYKRAARLIENGASIGVFPEATVNRDPRRLLPGTPGGARLSLQTGALVVPAGIRFPTHRGDGPIPPTAPAALTIGAPMVPPAIARAGRPEPDEIRAWHDELMRAISRLSGKSWEPAPSRPERRAADASRS